MSLKRKATRIGAALVIATLVFAGHAAAKEACPMLSDEAVEQVFGKPRHAQADPSGSCSWVLTDGTLSVMVHKQPTPKEVGELYDSYMKEMFAPLTRANQQPKIGRKAFAGMTPPAASMAQAGVLALDKDRVLSINFYPTSKGAFDEALVGTLVGLAQTAMAASPQAQQSYGDCEWFTSAEASRLLGGSKPRIHRLGANHCLASDSATQSALTVATDRLTTPRVLDNMRQSAEKSCTVVSVPELGFDAYAEFACGAPGDKAMSIHLLHKGIHAIVTFAPSVKPAVRADLDRLTPIAKRALERLGSL